MKKRLIVGGLVALVLAFLFPFGALAVTTPDILLLLGKGLDAVRLLVQDAYCAAGVAAFCP